MPVNIFQRSFYTRLMPTFCLFPHPRNKDWFLFLLSACCVSKGLASPLTPTSTCSIPALGANYKHWLGLKTSYTQQRKKERKCESEAFEGVRKRARKRDLELVGIEEGGGPEEANESIGSSTDLLLRK